MTTLLDAPPRPAAATQSAIRSTLVQRAMEALLAAQTRTDAGQLQIEERAVYRPDSWLIQQCWEALADAGAATEALTVARLAAPRQPLTLVQTLYRLSQQIDRKLGLANLIGQELTRIQPEVLAPAAARDDVTARDRLLFAAATASVIGDTQLALTFLERLDQFTAPWERPIVTPEQRQMLADAWVRLGLHPLSIAVITHALRRYSDAGAQFVLNVTTGASEHLRRPVASPRMARLLTVGVDTFRHATLTSLHARRLTAIALAQAGAIDDVLGRSRIVEGQHRQAAGHGLYRDIAEGLGDAGEQEHVGRGVVCGQVVATAHAGEHRACTVAFQQFALRAIADEYHFGCR